MERVQIFEGLKIEPYRESSLVQTFCESCVHFDFTHSSIHMNWRFVIQGCPTLNRQNNVIQMKTVDSVHMGV